MELSIFPSDKGDCLLLTGQDGSRMLIDGGMQPSYRRHVAPRLARLAEADGKLDVVYVSHIDADHIAGVLQLADDLLDWKIFDHVRADGDTDYPKPEAKRPPLVGEVWHNGFREQIGNGEDVEDILLKMATALSGHPDETLRRVASEQRDLATSERQAVFLQRRLSAKQLHIPLNPPANGKLMMVRDDNQPIAVGGMRAHILAPFREDLEVLKDRWDKWLRSAKGKKDVAEVRRDARKKEDLLRSSEVTEFLNILEGDAKSLGNRDEVTPPNLASLMLLIEEDSRTLLLTGDGHADEVLRGLRRLGRVEEDGSPGIHVDVFKIPHHGATANMTHELAMMVTADHYVFCGNGEHSNPELDVVERIIDSRLGPKAKQSGNPERDRPFNLWFSCSSGFEGLRKANVKHMRAVEQLVERRAGQSSGRLRSQFLADEPLVIEI